MKDSKALSKRKVSHKGARAKGLQFEREIANDLGHIFPEAKRQLEYQTSENCGTDIENTGPFQFQCKFHQNYVPVGTIKEIHPKSADHVPVLVTKGNNQEAMAILPWDKFVLILEAAAQSFKIRPFPVVPADAVISTDILAGHITYVEEDENLDSFI